MDGEPVENALTIADEGHKEIDQSSYHDPPGEESKQLQIFESEESERKS